MGYKYTVATRCITYNHAPYVMEALHGFSMQQTSFPCIFIIIDDASQDGEPDILRLWSKDNLSEVNEGDSIYKQMSYGELIYGVHNNNPNLFFAILLLAENHYQAHKSSLKMGYIAEWYENSKYHALCEGDDFWIDRFKLQRQVDYMDSHQECGMSYTMCKYFIQEKSSYYNKQGGPYETFADFLGNNNCVPSLTTVIRADLEKKYLEEIKPETRNWKMWDLPKWLWFSHESSIKFIPVETGVYRILISSASHSNDINKRMQFLESTHHIMRFFANYFNAEDLYNTELYYKGVFSICFKYGDKTNAIKAFNSINRPNYLEKCKACILKIPFLYKFYLKKYGVSVVERGR